MALEVRVFIVINKTDCCSEKSLEQTVDKIEFLLKSPGCGKIPLLIKSIDDAMLAAQHFIGYLNVFKLIDYLKNKIYFEKQF